MFERSGGRRSLRCAPPPRRSSSRRSPCCSRATTRSRRSVRCGRPSTPPQSVVLIVNTAVPYYIAGVAVAIGFKMNLFNIGSNGQYLLAALVAGWAGAEVSLPPVLHVALRVPRRDRRRRHVGAHRSHSERHPQRQRRGRRRSCSTTSRSASAAFLLSEVFRDEENGGLVAADQAHAGVGAAPIAQPGHRTRRLQLRPGRRTASASCRSPSHWASPTTSCSTAVGSATTSDCRA